MSTAVAAGGRVHRWRMPLVALAFGAFVVLAWDAALRDVRYPYSGDSASYVEMAESLLEHGRPRVSPWALESPHVDAVPQPLFPPGFPVLVAAFAPLAGDVRSAALWPSRIAAALVPLLVVVMFRGLVPDAALLGVGAWALLSPGVLKWHYVAYSDVTCLAFAIVALGALVRARGGDSRWLFVGGVAAGCAYAIRNAALAVLAAGFAAVAYDAWFAGRFEPSSASRTRAPGDDGASRRSERAAARHARPSGGVRAVLAWLAGAAAPLTAVFAYNVATFGRLQPYGMPPSVRPWSVNATDWVRAQLADLHVPASWLAHLPTAGALALVLLAVAAGVHWWWRTRGDTDVHRAIGVLGAYVAGGALLLVVSRSRYEWADTIEPRHALQYSWAIALLVVLAASRLRRAAVRRVLAGTAVVASAAIGVHAIAVARGHRASAPDAWLVVARDAKVVDVIRALPRDVLLASNASVLFRLATGRPVRLVEFAGGDRAFAGALAAVRAAAGSRPAAYVLWCHEYTAAASACATTARASGPACERLRGPPHIVALCGTDAASSVGARGAPSAVLGARGGARGAPSAVLDARGGARGAPSAVLGARDGAVKSVPAGTHRFPRPRVPAAGAGDPRVRRPASGVP